MSSNSYGQGFWHMGLPLCILLFFLAIDANINLMPITQGKESKIVFKQISSAGKLLVLKSFCIQFNRVSCSFPLISRKELQKGF